MPDSDPLLPEDRRDEAGFFRLIHTSAVGFWHIGADGLTRYLNPTMCRLLEVPDQGALAGTTFHRFFTPASLEVIRDEHRKRAAGVTSTYEVELVGLAGGRHNVMISGSPLMAPDGSLDGLIGTFTDITGMRRAEAQVRERDQAMEEHLRQAQKMDAIGLMAGGIAHDFNNLLTVIIGCSELLVRRLGSDGAAASNAVMIHSTAERAAALTRQLLTISRKQMITPQAVDLPALVVELAPMLRRMVGPGIDLRIDHPSRVPAVRADPQQMQQVVINLCVNARDAMPAGGSLVLGIAQVAVAEDPVRGTAAGTFVELAVIDHGIGMDAATQARIFEPFFTTKGPGKGTGLGLSTVYSIVTQTGGRLSVTSAPGQGCTFRILLPLAGDEDLPPTATAASLSPPTPSRARRILLVDDDETIRSLVCESLEDAGYLMTACATPAEALVRLRNDEPAPDVVISDVVMPDMNGWEFTRALDQLHAGVRLVLVSGFSAEGMPADIARRARTTFVAKPFTPSTLIAAVRALLEQR